MKTMNKGIEFSDLFLLVIDIQICTFKTFERKDFIEVCLTIQV